MKRITLYKAIMIRKIRNKQAEQVKKGRFNFVASVEELEKLTKKELEDLYNLVLANSI
ncbi:MAG: hypothetical protein J6T10_21485 [Methanobrevibacter sp.]|nr:hypothetical protein [Methanobrevibacter sp.]